MPVQSAINVARLQRCVSPMMTIGLGWLVDRLLDSWVGVRLVSLGES